MHERPKWHIKLTIWFKGGSYVTQSTSQHVGTYKAVHFEQGSSINFWLSGKYLATSHSSQERSEKIEPQTCLFYKAASYIYTAALCLQFVILKASLNVQPISFSVGWLFLFWNNVYLKLHGCWGATQPWNEIGKIYLTIYFALNIDIHSKHLHQGSKATWKFAAHTKVFEYSLWKKTTNCMLSFTLHIWVYMNTQHHVPQRYNPTLYLPLSLSAKLTLRRYPFIFLFHVWPVLYALYASKGSHWFHSQTAG